MPPKMRSYFHPFLIATTAIPCLAIPGEERELRTLELQPKYHNGTVTVEHLSVLGNLDGFKMSHPAAQKSADFWYFDVFSKSTNQTLNIVFFNFGDFIQYPHPLTVQVSGVYPNGTDFYFEALANDGVTITNGPSGVAGDWKGIGSFKGSPLDEPSIAYTITIDSADMGIFGNITFNSVSSSLPIARSSRLLTIRQIAPPRYPCDPIGAVGVTQNLLPGLYWSGAVPDSNAVADIEIGDIAIRFEDGIGYHDRNWGHGRVDPYSVVWYNLLDYHGNESRRAYVVEEGEILLLSCEIESMEVRQRGGKAAWPPTTGLLETEGLDIRYTLPSGEALVLEVTTELIVRDEKGAYQRANGHLKGGIVGGDVYEGRAHFEEFIFGIVNDYTPSL